MSMTNLYNLVCTSSTVISDFVQRCVTKILNIFLSIVCFIGLLANSQRIRIVLSFTCITSWAILGGVLIYELYTASVLYLIGDYWHNLFYVGIVTCLVMFYISCLRLIYQTDVEVCDRLLDDVAVYINLWWPGFKLFSIAVGLHIVRILLTLLTPYIMPNYELNFVSTLGAFTLFCLLVFTLATIALIVWFLPNKYPAPYMHPELVANAIWFSLCSYGLFWIFGHILVLETAQACPRCGVIQLAGCIFKNCFAAANNGNITCDNAKMFFKLAMIPDVMRHEMDYQARGYSHASRFASNYRNFIEVGYPKFPALMQLAHKDVTHAANENGSAMRLALHLDLMHPLVKFQFSQLKGGPDYVSKDIEVVAQFKAHLGKDLHNPMQPSQVAIQVNRALPNMVPETTHLLVTCSPGMENAVADKIKLEKANGPLELVVVSSDEYYSMDTAAQKQFEILNQQYKDAAEFKELQSKVEKATLDKLGFTVSEGTGVTKPKV